SIAVEDEPPTEPLEALIARADPALEQVRKPTPPPAPPVGPFSKTRFHFMTGMPAGETGNVRDGNGEGGLHYRSFASSPSVVAAVMAAIVIVTGLAAAVFLFTEERTVPGAIALLLAAAFAVMIAMLVPPTNATLYHGAQPAVTIAQQSSISIPVVTFLIAP